MQVDNCCRVRASSPMTEPARLCHGFKPYTSNKNVHWNVPSYCVLPCTTFWICHTSCIWPNSVTGVSHIRQRGTICTFFDVVQIETLDQAAQPLRYESKQRVTVSSEAHLICKFRFVFADTLLVWQ